MLDLGLATCSSLLSDIATSGTPLEGGVSVGEHLPEPVPEDCSSITLGVNQSAVQSGPLQGDVWTAEWYWGTVTGMAQAELVSGCKSNL
jgi:hypothetical protein